MDSISKPMVGFFLAALITVSVTGRSATAALEIDPDAVLPDADTLRSMAKANLAPAYLTSLKDKAFKLRDYKCYCRLYTRKNNVWKDYGGADYTYKSRSLFKAVIKTKDYRNGSVVVRDPSGVIKGCGGGSLSFMKITLKEDSRTLQLPTGYSLAQSDFGSLYQELQKSVAGGASATMTNAASVKAFPEQVTVIVLHAGPSADSPILEVLYISNETKVPVGWHTFKDGVPHALVLFQNLETNKGLSEDVFAF